VRATRGERRDQAEPMGLDPQCDSAIETIKSFITSRSPHCD
jgi:hypothetical protein